MLQHCLSKQTLRPRDCEPLECHWQKSKARPPLARLIRDAAGSSRVRSRSWLRHSAGDGEDVVAQDLGQQMGSGPRRAFQDHSGEVAGDPRAALSSGQQPFA
jgi:hypothetical protein